MNIKQKFESIDQSQLSESQKEILSKIKLATKNFTIEDKKSIEKVDNALDNIISKLEKTKPQAIKKEVKEEKKEAPKKEEAPRKETSKKATKSKTKTPKNGGDGKRTMFSIAKEIRKADESWEEAKKRAKKIMEQEKDETTKKMKTETEKLLAFIKRKKELKGLTGTSVKKDSKIEALPKGRRISKNGKRYYEYRDNRTDRLAPNFADKIYLEDGGYAGGGYIVVAKSEKGGGFVMSKPTTKVKAEKLKSLLPKIDGESNEVMTIGKASKLSGLVGKEYLKYADGGNVIDAFQIRTVRGVDSQPTEVLTNEQKVEFANGGTLIGVPETPLARGLDIDYTGLVGETGGMSAGEMFAMGGSLGNHGLKQGDQIIKTMSGGVQKVKTKSGDIVYVNLANGYRGAEPPLPFSDGGSVKRNLSRDIKFKNYSEKHEVRYSKDKPHRRGYGYEEGGFMTDPNFGDFQSGVYATGGGVGKKKTPKQLRNEYLEKLGSKEADVWDKIGAESGSQIRNSDKMLKAYAEGVEEMLQKEGVGKGSFDQEDYDFYTDENWHLFNEFLVWNGYYEPEMTKTEKAWREDRFKDPKYRNYVSNPSVIKVSGSSKSKSKSSKYIVKADIKEVKVKTDAGYEYTFKGSDVLNGVNILEKGSLLKNNATYVAKRNIMYVELKNGERIKPANGYWIKKDAKGELFKPEKKEEYKVMSNQAIFPKRGAGTYWYVENSKGQTINNTTGKPYKGKEMTNYYFLNEEEAKKFAKKLNNSSFEGGGKTTFKEKATAIAKKFEGKKVEPKYQKEYGKTYDKAEAKEVGNKIAGSQKAKYDSKMSGGGSVVNLDNKYVYITYEGQPLEGGETQRIVSHKYSDSKFDKKTLTLNFKDGSNLVLEKEISDFEKGKEVVVKSGEQYVAIQLLKDKAKTTKTSKGSSTKRGGAMQLAKEIRKEGESWASALKRANEQIRNQK